jgi:cysteinyl-tRNA synthetase
MSLTFYNTLTRSEQAFTPIKPKEVGLYTCGPTVYNYAHIGNFRAYIFEDLLKRSLQYHGYKVKHIMNLTDVDDKTIRGAQAAGLPLNTFTQKYKDAFFQDIAVLRIQPAELYPAATDHIQEMIDIVQILMDKGIAYQAEDKSVYFSIAKWPRYGQLVHIDPEQMRSGTRVKLDEYAKESVADFALWKAYDKQDGEVAWDSPWGKGRPGWHLECSAMSSKYLGKTFDIHCGGIDNMFPHHEDEIAQSEAANDCRFVNYWLHCAHLMVEGQKMSKSLGNFFTLRDLLDKGYSGREIRWVLIGTHYRQSLNFTFKTLEEARVALQRIDAFRGRLDELGQAPDSGGAEVKEALGAAAEGFQRGLADDLNISMALAALFDLIRDLNRLMDAGACAGAPARDARALLARFDEVLAVCMPDDSDEVPAEIQAKADARQAARKAKDFATADRLRQELEQLGWVVEDTPKGPRVKRK